MCVCCVCVIVCVCAHARLQVHMGTQKPLCRGTGSASSCAPPRGKIITTATTTVKGTTKRSQQALKSHAFIRLCVVVAVVIIFTMYVCVRVCISCASVNTLPRHRAAYYFTSTPSYAVLLLYFFRARKYQTAQPKSAHRYVYRLYKPAPTCEPRQTDRIHRGYS